MQNVGNVDLIGVSDDKPISYPCLIVENVKLLQQLEIFILKGASKSDTLVVPMYGIKSNGHAKYVGDVLLASFQILRMWYLGLNPKYYSSETEFSDFSSEDHLVGLCTNKGLR